MAKRTMRDCGARRMVAGFIAAALFAGCATTRPQETPTGPAVSLLTWNVDWQARDRMQIVHTLRATDADIVCLQETDRAWALLLRSELGQTYSRMEFRESAMRTGGGLAFLSKAPMSTIAYIRSDNTFFDAWIASFVTEVGTVQVLNVHLHPPVNEEGALGAGAYLSSRDAREAEIKRFAAPLVLDSPTVVAGDFNEEGGGALAWLESHGLANALGEFDKDTPTWQCQTTLATIRRRLDHIMYSPALHCFSARVANARGSDHRPVIAVFGAGRGQVN